MKINRIESDARLTNWVSGATDDGLAFSAKVFAGPSVHGIPTPRFGEGGNVSKLIVRDAEGREVYAWDRGRASTAYCAAEAVGEIVAALEAEFCGEGAR